MLYPDREEAMMIFYSKNAHKLQDSVVRESVAASTAPEKEADR